MLLHLGTLVVLLELIAVSLEDFQHLSWMAAAILNTCSDGYIKSSTYFISPRYVGHILGALDIPLLFPSPSGSDTALVYRGEACSKGCLISTPLIDGLDILIGGAVETHPSVSVETTLIFSEGR